MTVERKSVAKIGGIKEVKLFSTNENPTRAKLSHNEKWLCNLSYLISIS
jgi:hypothetical protein